MPSRRGYHGMTTPFWKDATGDVTPAFHSTGSARMIDRSFAGTSKARRTVPGPKSGGSHSGVGRPPIFAARCSGSVRRFASSPPRAGGVFRVALAPPALLRAHAVEGLARGGIGGTDLEGHVRVDVERAGLAQVEHLVGRVPDFDPLVSRLPRRARRTRREEEQRDGHNRGRGEPGEALHQFADRGPSGRTPAPRPPPRSRRPADAGGRAGRAARPASTRTG